MIEIVKIFSNGRSQAVRLPKDYRFSGNEVYAQKVGDAVLLLPKEKVWEVFLEGLSGFSSDFMCEGRLNDPDAAREPL